MKDKTIVLLLDANSATDNTQVKKWLKNSGLNTSEVPNVFRAMEEISDFTVCGCPEVVLIEAISPASDFHMIQQVLGCSDVDEISVFALSGTKKNINHEDCFVGNFVEVKAKLSSIHTKSARAKSAA